jgi:hypothetical protein
MARVTHNNTSGAMRFMGMRLLGRFLLGTWKVERPPVAAGLRGLLRLPQIPLALKSMEAHLAQGFPARGRVS